MSISCKNHHLFLLRVVSCHIKKLFFPANAFLFNFSLLSNLTAEHISWLRLFFLISFSTVLFPGLAPAEASPHGASSLQCRSWPATPAPLLLRRRLGHPRVRLRRPAFCPLGSPPGPWFLASPPPVVPARLPARAASSLPYPAPRRGLTRSCGSTAVRRSARCQARLPHA